MTLPALAELRALAPDATIDLVVGSWNRDLAARSRAVDRVETLDARVAGSRCARATGRSRLLHGARGWRRSATISRSISSPTSAATCCSPRAARARTGGIRQRRRRPAARPRARLRPARAHGRQRAAAGRADASIGPRPSAVRRRTADSRSRSRGSGAAAGRPLAGPLRLRHARQRRARHQAVAAKRASRDVAARLIAERAATIVLTGTPDDRAQVDQVRVGAAADRVVDVAGWRDLTRRRRGARAARPVRHRRHRPDAPGHTRWARRSWRCSVRRIRARYAPRGPRDRVVRVDLPVQPVQPHPPAAGERAPGTRPTAWPASMSPACWQAIDRGAGRPGAAAALQ